MLVRPCNWRSTWRHSYASLYIYIVHTCGNNVIFIIIVSYDIRSILGVPDIVRMVILILYLIPFIIYLTTPLISIFTSEVTVSTDYV